MFYIAEKHGGIRCTIATIGFVLAAELYLVAKMKILNCYGVLFALFCKVTAV